MIFSRFLLVAVAAVGVVAHSRSGHAHKIGMVRVPAKVDVAPRTYSASPYKDTIAKLNEYQEQTTDAMAGPVSEREAKLIEITAGVLDCVKTYNSDFKSKFLLLDLGNIAKGGEISTVGSVSLGRNMSPLCKGTRSQQLTDNIHAINVEVDSMGDFLAQKLPQPLSNMVIPAFAKYSDRMDMIEYATKPASY
ncbi:hypothetical protein AG1IA_05938 [Rhizoctonia solani AG-1 IA]|uniref:Uncharacterized protein n=1 Tax=Thanatephorus cucumeris (strain AG1-IA) TaxID=983506 RepID=L8WPD9_THACA|nr:hypothetical protein AG1IA_05938 [Rhizoctonia solani AG-1 IA]